jgi:hypothetical protein
MWFGGLFTMNSCWIFALMMLVSFSGSVEAEAPEPCKGNRRVIGECFMVHGRLRFYNGNPSFRIWAVGTNRVFGVKDDEEPIVPVKVAKHLAPGARDIFADFLLCPFTFERRGWMQMVCVESADHLVVRHYQCE